MALPPKDFLLTILKKLDEKSFDEFKTKLSTLQVKKTYTRIPSSRLEGADLQTVANLIMEFYPYPYGITVLRAVIDAINKKAVWIKLLDEMQENRHYFDIHRSDLIRLIDRVDPILYYLHYLKLLTNDQYVELTKLPTYQEKMESLLDIVRCWDEASKHKVFQALECYHPKILEELRRGFIEFHAGGMDGWNYPYGHVSSYEWEICKTPRKNQARIHFLDKYKEKLIKNIIMVDPVLDDLRDQQLLTQRQHTNLIEKATAWEKMISLYDTVRTWNYPNKEKVYKALKKYSYEMIKNLVTWEDRHYFDTQTIFKNHFLDRNQKELVEKIRNIDPVLRDLLDQHLLTGQQYAKMREKPSSQDKMRSLCDTIHNWSYTNKDKVYDTLRRHNYEELRALELSYIPSLFHGDLSDVSPPDYLYKYGCPKYQGAFVEPEVVLKLPPLLPLDTVKEHFLDRHWSFLERAIKFVDPVLFDLRDKMLITQKEFQNLISKPSSRDKMSELFGIMSSWNYGKKDLFYDALWKYNHDELSMLESQYRKKWDPLSTALEKPALKFVKTNMFYRLSIEKDVGVLSRHMECRLCGKFQDSGIVLNPDVIGNVFRLKLRCTGLFCCQKTGIKFQVIGPVAIDYYLESWGDHLEESSGSKYEIIGPLFHIKTSEHPMNNVVQAVYLPHYLCLRSFTEDQSSIKCAHFTSGNMALKTPTRVEPFYIVLENPTFSCLGPLLLFGKKKTPIHGVVLIYFRIICPGEPEYQEYKIHLHLLPLVAHIEEKLDKEKTKFGFQRISKPPQISDTVYTKIKYLINVRPGAYVHPKTLKFQSSHRSEPYQFTEISVKGNDIGIFLHVAEESTKETVWDTVITRGDIKDLSRSADRLRMQYGASSPLEHFVDKHRKDLIERLCHIDPILDDLLGQGLLTHEQYEIIRRREPHQEKMRQLYQYTASWGNTDKEKLYQAILRSNEPLVRDLQGE